VRIVGLAELPLILMHLLANDAERGALGQRAAATIRSQMGATARTLLALQTLLADIPLSPAASVQAVHTD
jgi:hypothetical protein